MVIPYPPTVVGLPVIPLKGMDVIEAGVKLNTPVWLSYAKLPAPEAAPTDTLTPVLSIVLLLISPCTNAVVAMFVLFEFAEGVGAVGDPVNAGELKGAFVAREFVTVVAKLASSFKAAANSFNVSSVVGAESTSASNLPCK